MRLRVWQLLWVCGYAAIALSATDVAWGVDQGGEAGDVVVGTATSMQKILPRAGAGKCSRRATWRSRLRGTRKRAFRC